MHWLIKLYERQSQHTPVKYDRNIPIFRSKSFFPVFIFLARIFTRKPPDCSIIYWRKYTIILTSLLVALENSPSKNWDLLSWMLYFANECFLWL